MAKRIPAKRQGQGYQGNPETDALNGDGELVNRSAAHLEALETLPPTINKPMKLPELDIRTVKIKIVGMPGSSLICHAWGEKAKRQMLDKQMMIASEGKEAKDPEADFKSSLYYLPDHTEVKPSYGFPAIAFKAAAVTACTSLGKSITKVQARQAFHVVGDMVKIEGDPPTMREDMVRIGMGKTADIRYRGEFKNWWCILTIRYNARVLSDEQILNLLNIAGFAVGVGEWRPERDGMSGLFHCK